jgi:cobalt-zinc-cadmium efflux system membrane fusion protein
MQMKTILAAGGALVLAGGGWWLLAPHGQAPTASEAPDAVGAAAVRPDGLLLVAPAKARALGIVTAPAQPASEVPLADLPVTIAPPPNARVAVAATLPGTVLRTLVVEGDSVSRGQALAVVASRDVMTLSADLARANARAGVARSSAARLNQLSREGIIAGARADEARALAAEAGADVAEKSRILRLVGSNRGGGTYTLTAPIAGRVTKADIQAGMPLDGTTAPFVIDAAGRYEATGQVPERLIGQIRPGMTVRLGQNTGSTGSRSRARHGHRGRQCHRSGHPLGHAQGPVARQPGPRCGPGRHHHRLGPGYDQRRVRRQYRRQVGRGHHRSRGRGHHAGHR